MMVKTAKCQRCGKYYEVLRPCEGDLHLTILQYGDRGGLEHDAYDLCNTCKRELGKWMHSGIVDPTDHYESQAVIARNPKVIEYGENGKNGIEFIFVKTCYECKHFRMIGLCVKYPVSRKASDPACMKWEV